MIIKATISSGIGAGMNGCAARAVSVLPVLSCPVAGRGCLSCRTRSAHTDTRRRPTERRRPARSRRRRRYWGGDSESRGDSAGESALRGDSAGEPTPWAREMYMRSSFILVALSEARCGSTTAPPQTE